MAISSEVENKFAPAFYAGTYKDIGGNMKKSLLCLLLAIAMVFSMTACGKEDEPVKETYRIVEITDAKSVDDQGFNQYTYEGIKQYCEEKGISYNYYMPTEQAKEAYLVQIETAVENGAEVICCPGYLFQPAVLEAQELYPEVYFICIDFEPTSEDYSVCKTGDKTVSVYFEEQESGFLAGYAAVKDGFTNLGFFGAMAVPSVKNFGYGYVYGAEVAAKELGLAPGAITMKYSYTGNFEIKGEYSTKAQGWYETGTQVIFGCGAPQNVLKAAEDYNAAGGNGWAIGVDTDESSHSETVLTSAMKNLAPVVYQLLTQWGEGTFPGGEVKRYSVNENACALPMATSRFTQFNAEQYEEIFNKLCNDEEFRASLPVAADFADDNMSPEDQAARLSEILEIVSLEVIR